MAPSRIAVFLLIVGTLRSTVSGQDCTDDDIHCFYDRSGGDKTAYCLQAGSHERQSHLSPTQIRALSCPLSLEMLAIFSSGRSNDTGIIDADCPSLSQLPSSNQSLFAVTNVTQLRVICDETKIRKKISGPSEAMETLGQGSSLTTPCDCIKRAAAAWSLGAILPSEYAYKCGADGHEDVVAASGTDVTTRLCNTNDRNPCVRGIWRVEVRWTSDDNIDLVLQLPADGREVSGFCNNPNGSSPRTCSSLISSITKGRWVVTVGPDDQSGSDSDGGFESATIAVENGPPSESRFSVYVLSKSGAPFNVNVTVKYFFNGAELVSVVPNIESPNTAGNNAWGTLFGLNILAFTFDTNPNSFAEVTL